jgi:acetolactate synthase-1/2/3 large subunit
VLVDVPKDVLQAPTTFSWPPQMWLPGYRPTPRPHTKQIREAAQLISAAARPVLYVGGGVIKASATDELLVLAELTRAPVVTTLMARGAFPDSHRQNLGMPGMHGTVPAVAAMQRADLLIALGARFDDRVTGDPASFAPAAKVIHVDIDPAEIGKIRQADVPIVGDVREVLDQLITAVRDEQHQTNARSTTPDLESWWSQLEAWRAAFPLGYDWPADGSLPPQYVIQRIGQLVGSEAIYTSGVGQHQMWAAQFITYEHPRSCLHSGGLGTMGYGLPAAMGAKLGRPETSVWCIDGDGCFQMTNQELATCAIERIPIKVAVINNGNLGMVRQWQNLFYSKRYSQTDLSRQIPDIVALAEALGCVGLRASTRDEVDTVIDKAITIDDIPVVIDFPVHHNALVWPMVPAGASNDTITTARDLAPVWEREH